MKINEIKGKFYYFKAQKLLVSCLGFEKSESNTVETVANKKILFTWPTNTYSGEIEPVSKLPKSHFLIGPGVIRAVRLIQARYNHSEYEVNSAKVTKTFFSLFFGFCVSDDVITKI